MAPRADRNCIYRSGGFYVQVVIAMQVAARWGLPPVNYEETVSAAATATGLPSGAVPRRGRGEAVWAIGMTAMPTAIIMAVAIMKAGRPTSRCRRRRYARASGADRDLT